MNSIKDTNYLVIQGWMRTQLDLKGNELLVYAIIYGFCQDGGEYHGSLQYIADFIGASRQTVINTIKSLVDKGLIEKRVETYPNNVKFNTYKISLQVVKKFDGGSQNFLTGVVKKFDGGSQNFLPNNNIYNNNIINNNINNTMSKTPEMENAGGGGTPQKIVEMFQTICRSYPKVRSISENRRKAIQARLRVHGIDTIKEVFEKAEASDFLKGKNNKNWSADFDWIMTDGNFSKILDGKYDNRGDNDGSGSRDTEKENPTVWEGIDLSAFYA